MNDRDGYIFSVTEVDDLFFNDNTKFILHNTNKLNLHACLFLRLGS